jgi:hypothetical protein
VGSETREGPPPHPGGEGLGLLTSYLSLLTFCLLSLLTHPLVTGVTSQIGPAAYTLLSGHDGCGYRYACVGDV